MLNWQSPEQLETLLKELVSWESISTTPGEIDFAHRVAEKLCTLDYFQTHQDQLHVGDAGEGRLFIAALSTHPEAVKTIVLISHFDTVGIEEYGELAPLAFHPDELGKAFVKYQDMLPPDAKRDLESGEYLWGRGTMDMKAGLAVHMAILEKAIAEKWPINLILLTVPDEEVNSAGMRAAVSHLSKWQQERGLDYGMFLNGEPVFSMNPSDTSYRIYSGSIGKIMPSALFYGKETHVGEPMSGMTSSLLAAFMTRRMEMNPLFKEEVYGEVTPLPVTLHQKDMRESYTTQTPFMTSALYNVFTMKQNAADVMNQFETVATTAAQEINEWYEAVCQMEQVQPVGKVQVLRYEELFSYAMKKLGKETVETIKQQCLGVDGHDDREKALQIGKTLLTRCPELAPAIILLYTPPYYPAVNSSEDTLIQSCIDAVTSVAKENFDLKVELGHYFNGISDLSYVNYQGDVSGWGAYESNSPVWNATYSIPFEDMEKLQAPVFNVGPFGKDAHKRTERLHKRSAFVETPVLVEQVIQTVIANAAKLEEHVK